MEGLFSESWMQRLQQNGTRIRTSGAAGDSGILGTHRLRLQGEDKPRGIMVIEKGKAIEAGSYVNGPLDWTFVPSRPNGRNG